MFMSIVYFSTINTNTEQKTDFIQDVSIFGHLYDSKWDLNNLSSVDILFVSTRRSCLVTVFYSTTITKPRDSHPHFLCPITDISLSDNLYYTPAFTVSGRHPFSSRLHILTSSTRFCPREFSSISTCRDPTLDPSFTKFETFVRGSN